MKFQSGGAANYAEEAKSEDMMSDQRAGERISEVDSREDYSNYDNNDVKSSRSSNVHYDYKSSEDPHSFRDDNHLDSRGQLYE